MISLAYAAILAVSILSMLAIDYRWKLVFFRDLPAASVAVSCSLALLLTWDVLGIESGIFFRGSTDYMSGLTIAPELPIEEVGFLFFLSYLTLVLVSGVDAVLVKRQQ